MQNHYIPLLGTNKLNIKDDYIFRQLIWKFTLTTTSDKNIIYCKPISLIISAI